MLYLLRCVLHNSIEVLIEKYFVIFWSVLWWRFKWSKNKAVETHVLFPETNKQADISFSFLPQLGFVVTTENFDYYFLF